MPADEPTFEHLCELYPGQMGMTLIALRARDKIPLHRGWNTEAVEHFNSQTDPGPILEHLARHIDKGGNVGWAIPPGALVLDADNQESAAWLRQALPDAPCQITAKGCHVVVKAPTGLDLSQRTRVEIFDGIEVDLRVAGAGQIACEPSIHPTGFAYQWETPLPLYVADLPDLPPGIAQNLNPPEADEPIPIHSATWPKGSQHFRLVSMAGRLRTAGLSVTEIEAALQRANLDRCEEPGTRENIAQIAHSAGKWDQGADPGGTDPVPASPNQIDEISFTGDRLKALLDEKPPGPVYPGTPPEGHFTLVVAPSFSGKTSFVLWNAMARVTGQRPWLGAPAREPGRVLFYSIDEPPQQVAWRIAELAKHHPGGRNLSQYLDRIRVVGPHRTVDPDKLEALRFTEYGLDALSGYIAAEPEDPYTDVIIDAYSDLLPLGISDTNNEEATRIGGALERMAVSNGIAIQMIHHAGKPIPGADRPDPRDLARGASALAAKARVIFTCEEEVGMSNLRRIRTRTNLTRSPKPLLLEVCESRSDDASRLDYFKAHDPATAYPVHEFVSEEDGWITTRELARRISGQDDPGGGAREEAARVRGVWDSAGLIETRKGSRNAVELRIKG